MVARLDYVRKKREQNRKRAVRRSKTMVRRKAKELWAKSGGQVYMLTLTYRPEDYREDFDSMRHDMRNFIRRVNWKIDRKCDYICGTRAGGGRERRKMALARGHRCASGLEGVGEAMA